MVDFLCLEQIWSHDLLWCSVIILLLLPVSSELSFPPKVLDKLGNLFSPRRCWTIQTQRQQRCLHLWADVLVLLYRTCFARICMFFQNNQQLSLKLDSPLLVCSDLHSRCSPAPVVHFEPVAVILGIFVVVLIILRCFLHETPTELNHLHLRTVWPS